MLLSPVLQMLLYPCGLTCWLATYLQPVAKEVIFGNEDFLHRTIFLKNLSAINTDEFTDKRVVIKGCGDKSNFGNGLC